MKKTFQVGEGFFGEGVNVAHINTVLGHKSGPAGISFINSLASPTIGHIPFLVVWKPNMPVSPATLFVNKAAIAGERHGELTWGAAQAGVAHGVTEYSAERFKKIGSSDAFVLLTAVWVNPEADDEQAVYANNRFATLAALRQGAPTSQESKALLDFRSGGFAANPYFGGD